jgi:hypothetical protein
MATTITTTSAVLVPCPGICGDKCGGEMVAARGFFSPRAKTVRVDACSALLTQGWKGHQMAYTKAEFAKYLATV